MGLFDTIQNIISSATELLGGSVGDVVGGVTDNQAIQDIADQASSLADSVTDATNSAKEQGQSAVEEAGNKLGL